MAVTSRETIETKPIIALREFFSTGAKPVSMLEFTEFWKSCTEAEKNDLRAAIKYWDGESHLAKPIPAVV